MASAQAIRGEHEIGGSDQKAGSKGKRKLIVLGAMAALLIAGGAAAFMTGAVGRLTGGSSEHEAAAAQPGFIDLPDIVANLNTVGRRSAFVRLKARLELTSKADQPAAAAATPRILDLFQTYLRDMRPEELRGSAGTYRLREELIGRANIALAPARVTDILFIEMLVQ
jgi:flagellar FliL protein